MRRFVSILMVLLCWLAPLSALLPGSGDAQLPACCRRHGAHHCAMAAALAAQMEQGGVAGDRVSAPMHCPLYRGNAPAPTAVYVLYAPTMGAHVVEARLPVAKDSPAQWQRSRSSADRGPPLTV